MRPRNETFIQSGWAISHARRLVSSKPEASESQASTHMYNCRRALEDSQYLGISKRSFRSFM